MISSSRRDGVAALLIARFNSRRVRLISWWLRMTLTRRDIATILSQILLSFEDHLFNGGWALNIPVVSWSGARSGLANLRSVGRSGAASTLRRDARAG